MGFKELAKLINQANKVKTPEQQFLYELNEAIGRLDAEDNRPPSRSFKPSSIGGCLRIPFFQIIGAPTDAQASTDPGLVGICESGTDRHVRIQTAVANMKRLGYDVEWVDVAEYIKHHPVKGTRIVKQTGMETKLFNDVFNMSFMCDGIIKFHGKYYILEIKTETSFKWQGRTDANFDHKKQASCYSLCLGINSVMFLYENRDVCSKKAFEVEVTDEMRGEIVHIVETVNMHIEQGTTPPKDDTGCKYCDYKGECVKR